MTSPDRLAVLQSYSDERMKTDIQHVGHDGKRDWFDYRYLWDEPGTVRRGVMAQQLLTTDPQAVHVHDSGYLMVNYASLD
jgi:hypothetical protein